MLYVSMFAIYPDSRIRFEAPFVATYALVVLEFRIALDVTLDFDSENFSRFAIMWDFSALSRPATLIYG